MMHKATITLPMTRLEIYIGLVATTMVCLPFDIEVEYRFAPGRPASDEGPEDNPVFAAMSARLKLSLAMHNSEDTMSLVIGAKTDLLQYLGARQIDWIEEHLPVPAAI